MKFNVKKPLSVFLAAVMLLSVCAFFSAAAAETADPVGASFTVNAKSNFFAAKTETVTVPSGDMFVTVEYKLNAPKMSLINIARSGFFSSMRTARQYNERVWHLG